MRIGIVCPYSMEVPGGVQLHVRDLAEALIAMGHEVSVLAPADDEQDLPPYVVAAGRAVAVPYNGSVARLNFGPISAARVRRWLNQGSFDVVHVHEPTTPSLSLLAVMACDGPIVATFHTAMTRSAVLSAGRKVAQLVLERITARIAVSALARRVQVEHLDGGAVEIPNGVAVSKFADALPLSYSGELVGFLGRFTEPRKGFDVLAQALEAVMPQRPALRLLLAGPSDLDEVKLPHVVASRIEFLGRVSEEDKARMLRTVDVYVAPNTGGESFGMILTEAMAAGAAIIASDLDAFRRVLDGGKAGVLFPVGDSEALASSIVDLLDDGERRQALSEAARKAVAAYDWPVVAQQVLEVYQTAIDAYTDPSTT
ncbi:glycosyltransferase family 4 protein [Allorhizocola rhizosphaerae]|uniref:glycosyltransferase family 4 protein n=1 Tax=Allorhizocola rhizosphaerae TaxID=1872709 RepID=UPI000E3D5EAB|nr:glycosyltransferase family 4 protein [Allorhizocola rhizosphaerae]